MNEFENVETTEDKGYGPKKSSAPSSDSRKFCGRGFMCLSSLALASYLHKYFKKET